MSAWDRAALTPWELRGGRWYKREDYYAPLGRRSINGAKLRQLDYLLERAAEQGFERVVTGCSILSPQASMAAIVARRYGLACRVYVGGTSEATMCRKPNVQIALEAGATFDIGPVGYNPALQRRVRDAEATDPKAYRLCYGITTPEDARPWEVLNFHSVGAAQASNIPAEVEHLVIPFGSGNSATSALLGLLSFSRQPRVTLVGIGPSRLRWMMDRLETMGVSLAGLDLMVTDLHAAGRFTYQDRQPAERDGIVFHPTYEGKVVTAMDEQADLFPGWHRRDGSTALWIVGAESDPEATRLAISDYSCGSNYCDDPACVHNKPEHPDYCSHSEVL